jgi:hypothetical protein
MRQVALLNAPFTAAEAASLGVSRYLLRDWVEQGIVRQVLHRVYVGEHVDDSYGLRARALAKVLPPGAVACRLTAAWLHGVDVLPLGSHRTPPPVQAAVPRGSTALRRAGCQGFVAALEPQDVMQVDGIAVTTPLRTGLDLGRLLKRVDAVIAVDALLHAELFTLDQLVAALPQAERLRGVVQLRWVADNCEPKSESPMETRLRLRVVDAGLPRPMAQIEVLDEFDNVLYRLDLGYEEVKLGLEFDGVDPHTGVDPRTGELRFDRDRRRLRELSRRGWLILTFTGPDVLRRGEHVAREVEAALIQRGYRPL